MATYDDDYYDAIENELYTGPLAQEVEPYIESGQDGEISNIMNRQDITVKGILKVESVAQYLSLSSSRIPILESTTKACKALNQSLIDFGKTGFDLSSPVVYDSLSANLQAIADDATIPEFTTESKDALLALGNKLISRAQEIELVFSIDTIAIALRGS